MSSVHILWFLKCNFQKFFSFKKNQCYIFKFVELLANFCKTNTRDTLIWCVYEICYLVYVLETQVLK